MKIFLDTETTGLPKKRNASYSDVENWPRLVQLAWVLMDDAGREICAEERIVIPDGFVIPEAAARVHGITTEDARKRGNPLVEVLGEFTAALENATTIIAHNVAYDRPVLESELIRQGNNGHFSGKSFLCTMEVSTNYCALPSRYGYKWPTLDELHRKLFGRPMGAAHNALVDVRACIACFNELQRIGLIESSAGTAQSKADREGSVETDNYTRKLIDEIYELAKEESWFDTDFVDSLSESLDDYGSLTDKQMAALEKIADMLRNRS